MKKNKVVVAEGEQTGHAHRVEGYGAAVLEADGVKTLSIASGGEISHEEHKKIDLPPGEYTIDIVKEMNWEEEEIKNVAD